MQRRIFRVPGRRDEYLTEAAALQDALDPEGVFRLTLTRRGIRFIERRTAGGNWMRVQTLPDRPQ